MAVALDDPPMGRYLLKKTRSPNIYLLIYVYQVIGVVMCFLKRERERENFMGYTWMTTTHTTEHVP